MNGPETSWPNPTTLMLTLLVKHLEVVVQLRGVTG